MIIFGKVVNVTSINPNSCKCDCGYNAVYIKTDNNQNIDLIDELNCRIGGFLRYLVFKNEELALELINNVKLGKYEENSILENYMSQKVLEEFYIDESSNYFHTCYSEWTCGYPGTESYIERIDELKSLVGRYVIFKL